ncbi:MAG: tyrosine-type recombinase/integrase, partial [Pseudomonadota bacterium]
MSLPKNVYRKGNTLYYAKQVDGRRKFINLCPVGSPDAEIYRRITEILAAQIEQRTLGDVMDDYKRVGIPELAISSQADYSAIIENKLRPWVGQMHPDDVTTRDVAMYLELRKRQRQPDRGNKEIAVLGSVYRHGLRMGICNHQPTHGAGRNKVKPRTYYVSDESLRLALRHSDVSLRHILWAAYLTGFRQRDLRELTKDNLTPEGIKVVQSKDGKHEVRLWSESLRKVVRRALERSKCDHVFTNERGQKMSLSAIQCAMRRLKDRAPSIDWRFHDIRAKAESDHRQGLGLMRRYQRATKRA